MGSQGVTPFDAALEGHGSDACVGTVVKGV